jgi:hypothetical protein
MALQRPTATIEPVSEGSGGLVGAVTSLIGSTPPGLPAAAVTSLTVDTSVGSGHDRVDIVVSAMSSLADTEPGAKLAVALGYGDENTDVMTADVHRRETTPNGIAFVGYSPTRRLSSTFVARSYIRQTVADVVSDLLVEAEVDEGDIEAGHDLPAYHLDGSRSAWAEIHLLARRTGSQVRSTAEGGLSFAPAPGSSSSGALGSAVSAIGSAIGLGSGAELRKGATIIDWRAGTRGAAPAFAHSVVAVGAASPLGADRWHHMVKSPSSGATPAIVDVALRSGASADLATAARSDAARRATITGRFRVPGDPALRAGDTVTVDDVVYRMLEVTHRIAESVGFVTDLVVEGGE